MKTRKQGQTARQKEAAAKRKRYAAARAKGKTPKKALREAGYKPGTSRAAASMAASIDKRLGSTEDLEAALVAEGITLAQIAKRVKRCLNSIDGRVSAQALKLISNWKQWGKPADETPKPPWLNLNPEELAAARAAIVLALAERRGPGGGPAHPGPAAGGPAQGQPAAPDPPSA